MNALAMVELRNGALRKVSYEVVTAARQAADSSGGGEVHALAIGGPGTAGLVAELGRFGADGVVVVEHAGLARYSPEVCAATAAARLQAGGYRAGFFAASAEGRDLAPRVAAALGTALASDVTGFELSGDAVLARHPVYIGKAIATLRLTGSPALLSLRPGALSAKEAPRTPRIEAAPPAMDPAAARVVVTDVAASGGARLDIGEAPVVVSGGRGLRAA